MTDWLILIPLFLPILGAFLLLWKPFGESSRRNLCVHAVTLSAFLVSGVIAVTVKQADIHFFTVNRFLDLHFHVDPLGMLFSLLAGFLWILTGFFSIAYMSHAHNRKQFFFFFLFTLGIIHGIALAANMFTLYLYYEILTLSTFPLVIHAGTPDALDSGKKYLIYSFSGAAFILLGMLLLYSQTGTLDLIPKGILDPAADMDRTLIFLSYISLFIGFGVKAALVPFHSWLPAAMVAPTPVSALLHAVAVVKSGIFSIVRVTYFLFGAGAVQASGALGWITPFVILTVLLGSVMAMHQENLKKRLAYSTISQLGYMLLGIVLMNATALTGSLLHLVNHALIKISLFFIVGTIYHQTGKTTLSEIRGIGKAYPVLMICSAIAAVSLIGIPPANGFVSKWFLARGALQAGSLFFAVSLLLSAFLTAGYMLPIPVNAFFRTEKAEGEYPPIAMSLTAPVVILTVVICFLGLFPNPLISALERVVGSIL